MARKMFSAETDTQGYIRLMKRLGNRVLPEVVADALNDTADETTRASLKNLHDSVIVRRKFTTNSFVNRAAKPYMALRKAMGHKVERMFSRSGTFSPYLQLHEYGATVNAEGEKVPIPTEVARGGSEEKSIRSKYNLGRMGSVKDSSRFFIGKPRGAIDRPLGMYERFANNKRLRMVRNLESDMVKIKPKRFHRKAVSRYGTSSDVTAHFRRHASRRLRRLGR